MRAPNILWMVAIGLLVGLAFGARGSVGLAQPPQPSASDEIAGLVPLPPKGPPKMETGLWRLAEALQRGGFPSVQDEAGRSAIATYDGSVRIVVEASADQTADAAALATSMGGKVETTYADLVQVLAPVGILEDLANASAVRLVREPLRAVPATVTSQGVDLVNAPAWHTAGFTGAGVKVAVLDLGFQDYQGLLGSELPAAVTAHSCRADGDITGGGQKHGTAVAEIVHDMAPDASLYLVNFGTDVELGNCVSWLTSQGVEVINHSVNWFGSGPGDGTGPINVIAGGAVAAGIFWANSAGNFAQRHWMGNWSDPESNTWQNFAVNGEGNGFYVPSGGRVTAILKWDDPFGGSSNDYDLYLVDAGFNVVDGCYSASLQDGSPAAVPVEVFSCTPPGTGGTYALAIARFNADGLAQFHLYNFYEDLQYQSAAQSIGEPADNPAVKAAGTVPWNNPAVIEPFSACGPTHDGRIKPDLAGPDAVDTATYGAGNFLGTSAASPHVAGAAALVKQAFPAWAPAQIGQFLEDKAVDLGAAGKDNTYGAGRLYLDGLPPFAVGGSVQELPDVAQGAAPATAAVRESSSLPYAAMAGTAVGGTLLLTAGGWYARRRRRTS